MTDPLAQITTKQTPITQPIPGRTDQVKNNDGGYVFAQDDWHRFESFLILGSEGGTYYVGEKELTKQNVKVLFKLLAIDGIRVVDMILDVSLNGRAYKQNPTLFSLAAAASHGIGSSKDADTKVRAYALSKVSDVCRTGTMLYQFVNYCENMRGWGSAMQRAVGDWYTLRTPGSLANQVVKYRQRDGWSHKDLLRLAKPKINEGHPNHTAVRWLVGKGEAPTEGLIAGYLAAQAATTTAEWVKLIGMFNLPWEALPTIALNEAGVWEALVPHMGLTALLRNLGKMGSVKNGLVSHSNLAKMINARLTATDEYKTARVHPMQVLLASSTYGAGRGVKGNNAWVPVPTIIDNLTSAFYATFGNLPVTNKRRFMGLDVSGSMAAPIMNTHLSCREAESALCLIAFQQDPESTVMAFDTGMKQLNFSAKMRLPDAINEVNRINNFGGTNCSMPMVWALKEKLTFDSFEIYTDSETNTGNIHPVQALKAYRDKMGINAKLVVNGMTSGGFTISDPTDGNSLDCIGFDANTPKVISEFISG